MVWPRVNWRALTDASNIDAKIFFLLAHATHYMSLESVGA